jgi:hypothetical protein
MRSSIRLALEHVGVEPAAELSAVNLVDDAAMGMFPGATVKWKNSRRAVQRLSAALEFPR